jgi:hypothetical protein
MFKRQLLLEIFATLLILLFLYASLSKFLDFRTFIKEMNNQPLPNSWTPFLVWFIPCLEIFLSITLVLERTRLMGFYGSLILMSLFTIYTAVILLHFFSYIPCSCGGIIKRLSWRQHLIFNLFFIAVSLGGIILQLQFHIHL